MNRCFRKSVLIGIVIGLGGLAHGASINWGPVESTTASAANDVVDGGEVVLAINGRSQSNSSSRRPPASVRLDGIKFDTVSLSRFLGRQATDIERALSLPTSTGDSEYDAFLTHVAFSDVSNSGLGGTDKNTIYSIGGLTRNSDYLVQLWYTDERPGVLSGFVPRIAIFGDNERVENTVNVPGLGDNGFGSFVVGSFTADSRTQDLRMTITNANRAHLTGILVREACMQGLGDLDNDGVVQFTDFLILSSNFGFEGRPADGDLDCNGFIGFADFLILSENFGQVVTEARAVPEPSGHAPLVSTVLLLTLVRSGSRGAKEVR